MKFLKNSFVFILVFTVSFLINCETKKFKLDRKIAEKKISEHFGFPKTYTLKIATGKFLSDFEFERLSGWGDDWYDVMFKRDFSKGGIPYILLNSEINNYVETTIKFLPYEVIRRERFAIIYDLPVYIEIKPKETANKYIVKTIDEKLVAGISYRYSQLFGVKDEKIEGESNSIFLKICDKVLVGITGIGFFGDTSAVVEYNWKYENITPVKQTLERIENFSRYVISGHGFKGFISTDFYREIVEGRIDNRIHSDKLKFALYDDGWRILEEK